MPNSIKENKKPPVRLILLGVILLLIVVLGAFGGIAYWNSTKKSEASFNPSDYIGQASNSVLDTANNSIDEQEAIDVPAESEFDLLIDEAVSLSKKEPQSHSVEPVESTTSILFAQSSSLTVTEASEPTESITIQNNNPVGESQTRVKVPVVVEPCESPELVDSLKQQITELQGEIKRLKTSTTSKSPQPKNKSQKPSRKKSTKHRVKAIKRHWPTFVFVSIEYWDGVKNAVVESEEGLTQLSLGEDHKGWVLIDSVYPNRAKFKHRATGQVITLSSDGRLPND